MAPSAYFGRYKEIPFGAVEPQGWLRFWLEKQKQGLTGHLEAAGAPFDTPGWRVSGLTHGEDPNWWPYEQNAYWVDAMVRCGLLLKDDFLIAKALESIESVLKHPDKDAYLGPRSIKKPERSNRWAHAVFFRALMPLYSARKDRRIVDRLAAHYLSGTSPHVESREVCNIETLLWLYAQTGRRRFLDMAVDAYGAFKPAADETAMTMDSLLSPDKPWGHGISFSEFSKLPALLYLYTGDRKRLAATRNAMAKADRHHGLVDGAWSSSEFMAGRSPLAAHETCIVSDQTWTMGAMLLATGEGSWADRIERVCFNAGPGAVKDDFKALQYFSSPNQVLATGNSDPNPLARGRGFMRYAPNPGTECCPGNVNRFMPNYVARMWMLDRRGDLVAALYGPSRITAVVGRPGTEVDIVEETSYPFGETVSFQIRCPKPVVFGLRLRIPGWCRGAGLTLNGKPLPLKAKPGGSFTVRRRYAHNDRLCLSLPMEPRRGSSAGGVFLERGPLVYALGIAEDWRRDRSDRRSTDEFPAYNLFPAGPWNYALALKPGPPKDQVKVVHRPLGLDPWRSDAAPVELHVPARRVRSWTLKRSRSVLRGYPGKETLVKGDFVSTPELPDPDSLRGRLGPLETIVLRPYGCTHLRLTVFPDAREGKRPPK